MLGRFLDVLLGRKSRDVESSKARPIRSNDPPTPFAAVSIAASSDNCCEAAKRLMGQRFLAHEAPLLRLPDCSIQNCACRYVRFDDRRQGARREIERGVTTHFRYAGDRRASRGRRAGDIAWAR